MLVGEVALPAAVDERASLVPAAREVEPAHPLEPDPLEDAVAVEGWPVSERALRREPLLVGDRLDPLPEVAPGELRPLDGQADVAQPQFHLGDLRLEERQ